ncbi:restriction endonuclease subunit S [Collinsella tanakaei]|nr:restriction endonuclease subunit S [Collinsella tanakaei]
MWGKEQPQDDCNVRVAVVRGADFPAIQCHGIARLPLRYEKKSKVEKASLRPGDIIIEISGGTDTRPTGRTLLVTEYLLAAYDCPIIPASFCRLMRPKADINSAYLAYWLNDMYAKGRTWGYQNRSTGLSNFQFKVFSEFEQVFIPDSEVQRAIAFLLGSLDEKIYLNQRTNDYLAA